MLGTSGSSEDRCAPVTANARILPPCTSGIVGGPSAMANSELPPAMLSIISLLLLYGTPTAGMPVLSLNSSVVMVKAGEEVAQFDLSGFALPYATRSLTDLILSSA